MLPAISTGFRLCINCCRTLESTREYWYRESGSGEDSDILILLRKKRTEKDLFHQR